jgi:hypothetical protein
MRRGGGPNQYPYASVLPKPLVSERSPPMLRAAIEGSTNSGAAGESTYTPEFRDQGRSNDEVERRGVALPTNEADLSQSSTLSLVHRRRGPRSLEPIVRRLQHPCTTAAATPGVQSNPSRSKFP